MGTLARLSDRLALNPTDWTLPQLADPRSRLTRENLGSTTPIPASPKTGSLRIPRIRTPGRFYSPTGRPRSRRGRAGRGGAAAIGRFGTPPQTRTWPSRPHPCPKPSTHPHRRPRATAAHPSAPTHRPPRTHRPPAVSRQPSAVSRQPPSRPGVQARRDRARKPRPAAKPTPTRRPTPGPHPSGPPARFSPVLERAESRVERSGIGVADATGGSALYSARGSTTLTKKRAARTRTGWRSELVLNGGPNPYGIRERSTCSRQRPRPPSGRRRNRREPMHIPCRPRDPRQEPLSPR